MRKSVLLQISAFLFPSLLILPHSILAQEFPIELRVQNLARKKAIQLSIIPDRSVGECPVRVYANTSKRRLEEAPENSILLENVETLAAEQTVLATRVPSLPAGLNRRRRSVFVQAVADCESFSGASAIKRILIPESGQSRLRASKSTWVRRFRDRILTNQFEVTPAFPSLTFSRPVDMQSPGAHSNLLYVVGQEGVIDVFENSSSISSKSEFLDLADKIEFNGGEQGLLGLAFHPRVQENRQFFVSYTEKDTGSSVIARYHISQADERVAETVEERLLVVPQPAANHNGGAIRFGPDGFLYVAIGDGGGGGDPFENGQNPTTLPGAILRIDVDSSSEQLAYGIPASNPFVGNNNGFREEIYAYGLRNPWRFSFDSRSGALWLADVGQSAIEEIDIIKSGGNYGWNTMEGSSCYPSTAECDKTGLALPVHEYSHVLGKSVTGGYVIRGAELKRLRGMYVYADFITGRIWALKRLGSRVVHTQLVSSGKYIASFATDAQESLYILTFDGLIYRLQER